ncbi:MAG: S41 family peptidase [Puniceicoccales bacterium]|jgi:hypothetical protein|nr:S41 family peptidase [Puniceicoccales bacterium]
MISIALVFAVAGIIVRQAARWQDLYREDLATIFATVEEHSPARFIEDFSLQRELGLAKILLPLRRVHSQIAYKEALGLISKLFGRHHIYVIFHAPSIVTAGDDTVQNFSWHKTDDGKTAMAQFYRCRLTTDEERKDFDKFLEALAADEFESVIIDLSGNRGGDSSYCERIVAALIGEIGVDALFNAYYGATHSRLTGKNIDLWEGDGLNAAIVAEMRRALADGVNMFVEPFELSDSSVEKATFAIPKKLRLIEVIIDENTASAAISLASMLRMSDLPVTTVGDSGVFEYAYGEIDRRPLKSGLGEFYFPTKYFAMKDDKPTRLIPEKRMATEKIP